MIDPMGTKFQQILDFGEQSEVRVMAVACELYEKRIVSGPIYACFEVLHLGIILQPTRIRRLFDSYQNELPQLLCGQCYLSPLPANLSEK